MYVENVGVGKPCHYCCCSILEVTKAYVYPSAANQGLVLDHFHVAQRPCLTCVCCSSYLLLKTPNRWRTPNRLFAPLGAGSAFQPNLLPESPDSKKPRQPPLCHDYHDRTPALVTSAHANATRLCFISDAADPWVTMLRVTLTWLRRISATWQIHGQDDTAGNSVLAIFAFHADTS